MNQFFLRNFQPKFYPKKCLFGFFQLIKSYAETIMSIDEKYLSQETSQTAQQSFRKLKSPKICVNCLKFVLNKDCGFYIVKITFLDYQAKIFSPIHVFGDLDFLKFCCRLCKRLLVRIFFRQITK